MREDAFETKLVQVANEAICGGAKSERVTPKVPLEGDDRGREHAGPDEGEGRLSASKTGVEEGQTRNHDQNHSRGDDDEGLVARIIPLVQIFGDCVDFGVSTRGSWKTRIVGAWGL